MPLPFDFCLWLGDAVACLLLSPSSAFLLLSFSYSFLSVVALDLSISRGVCLISRVSYVAHVFWFFAFFVAFLFRRIFFFGLRRFFLSPSLSPFFSFSISAPHITFTYRKQHGVVQLAWTGFGAQLRERQTDEHIRPCCIPPTTTLPCLSLSRMPWKN